MLAGKTARTAYSKTPAQLALKRYLGLSRTRLQARSVVTLTVIPS